MNRTPLHNALIALVGALLFTNFVVLAEGLGPSKPSSSTLTIATTTTTFRQPAPPVTTATTLVFTTPTTGAVVTPTTVQVTTTTAKKVAATTTTRSSTTSTTTSQRGVVTEASDNSASFTHNADGSYSADATAAPANDRLSFTVTTAVVSVSGDTANVRFSGMLDNQSGRTVTFPGGLQISLTVTPPSGPAYVIQLNASSVTSLDTGNQVKLSAAQDAAGYGHFQVVGSCQVDYGS